MENWWLLHAHLIGRRDAALLSVPEERSSRNATISRANALEGGSESHTLTNKTGQLLDADPSHLQEGQTLLYSSVG